MNRPLFSYGLLAQIVRLCATRHFELGRTKVQKLVFLLNELGGIDTGYSFRFYTYGPYSSGLAGDIDYLDRIGVLSVKEIDESERYEISPGIQAEKVQKMSAEPLEEIEEKIERIISEFGSMSARDLELTATLIYVSKYDPDFSGSATQLVAKARELKPKFLDQDIENKVERLAKRNFLSLLVPA